MIFLLFNRVRPNAIVQHTRLRICRDRTGVSA